MSRLAWTAKANEGEWTPSFARDGFRWYDKTNEVQLSEHIIHWSGWTRCWNQDAHVAYWAAYPVSIGKESKTTISPVFGEVSEIQGYDLIDYSKGGLTWHMGQGDDAKLLQLANRAKRQAFDKLLVFLGYDPRNHDGVYALFSTAPKPSEEDELAWAQADGKPRDGTHGCAKCGQPLNRADVNCWKCGATEIKAK